LIGTAWLELRVRHGFSLDALDLSHGCEPTVSLLHRSLDPLFRIESHRKATDAFTASLFLVDLQKSALLQEGKPVLDGLPQIGAKAGKRSIEWELSPVLTHGLHGDEVKESHRLEDCFKFGEAAVVCDLDKHGSLALRRRLPGPEGHNVPAHELAPVSVLLDLLRLRHEVDGAVCAFEDEKGSAPCFVFRSRHHSPVELDSRDELAEELRCIGIDQELAVAGHALLEVAGQLHLLERGPMVLGELEGTLADALGEAEAGQEPEPPQKLEAKLSGGL
jgi:hypothetical protein